jgi:DNA-binding MurR/RpiR family transcriptional regulator
MIAETLSPMLRPHLRDLTQTEQILIRSLTQHPEQALFMSARELASAAGVHSSSAVRLAKKLGFEGYPEFRRALQSRHASSGAAQRVARTVSSSADGDVIGQLIEREQHSLDSIRTSVSQARLDQAAALLSRASGIAIWAAGNSKVLSDLLDRRLRRAGYPSQNIASEGREFAERLSPLCAGQVLVCFAFRREPAGLSTAIAHAKQVGAATILIADTLAHTLSAQPDVILAAPRGSDEEFLTLTVPMLVTNALVLTLARTDGGRSMRGLQSLEGLYAKLDSSK